MELMRGLNTHDSNVTGYKVSTASVRWKNKQIPNKREKKNHCSKCSHYGKDIRLHYNEMERHRTVLSRKISFFEAKFSLFTGFDLGKRSLKRRGFYAVDYHKSHFHHCNHVEGNRAPYFHNHIVPNAHDIWKMIYDHSLATWSIGESFGNTAEDIREHLVLSLTVQTMRPGLGKWPL